ncbi:hypothetical protein LSCM1_01265 [Leishmania martiniquensis]|uniref:Uncharacterized protein n=1 Tax=Leishmania martiniquensis TaxID=1580590 RepID=A0A836G655_9TRYP|nr:hypothetical protein LSCM1_01265 [Leishmania martiniquensis]
MTSNPYIAQHYGSLVEVMSNGHEDEADASVGFRRLQNAPHMTHTVFRPSKNLDTSSTATAPPSAWGIHGAYKTLTPDAYSALHCHKGLLIDEFPSRPQTPRCAKSSSSLPPLLPADRLSVGSSDGFRDKGADHIREWVKASTTSSAYSTDDVAGDDGDTGAGIEKARSLLELASPSLSAPQLTPETESEQQCTSAPAPSSAAAPVKASLALSDRGPSVSVSPESLHPAHTKSSMPSPTTLPVPEATIETTVDAALRRLHDALAQAQRVLDTSRIPGNERTLVPPPALPPQPVEPAQIHRQVAPVPTPTASRSLMNEEGALDDSLDCLSPLVSTHMPLRGFPSAELPVGIPAAASLTSPVTKAADTVSVPDETRFMVLCAITHPTAVMERRIRRRGPAAEVSSKGLGCWTARSPFTMSIATDARRTPPRRIAEVQRSPAAIRATTLAQTTTAAQQLQSSPSANASSDGHPSSRTSTQRRPVEDSASRLLNENPPGMPGLAEFLRAGNPKGFSSLSAATRATSPHVKPVPSAHDPHRRPRPPVAATAAPGVLLGHAPLLSLRRGSSGTAQPHANRIVTPSSQLPYSHAEGSVAAADVLARRTSSRTRRVDSMPSYAQPTLSWLSKGPEASTDEFPVSRVASPQTSPLKDMAAASRDGEQSDRGRG